MQRQQNATTPLLGAPIRLCGDLLVIFKSYFIPLAAHVY